MRTLLASAILWLATIADAATLIETAPYTNEDRRGGSGSVIAVDQWLGLRFTLDRPAQVTEIGGQLAGRWPNSEIFAGLLPIDGPAGLPPGGGLNPFMTPAPDDVPNYGVVESDFLAHGIFTAQGDVQSPLDASVAVDVLLPAGSYLLVFGSGLFGVTGGGALPAYSPRVPGFTGDVIYGGYPVINPGPGPTVEGPWAWQFESNDPNRFPRYFVNGQFVPEPSGLALIAFAFASAGMMGRRNGS
jgi:hypothetical protein